MPKKRKAVDTRVRQAQFFSLSLPPLIRAPIFLCSSFQHTEISGSYLLAARNTETPPESRTQHFYWSPFFYVCQSTCIQLVLFSGASQPEPALSSWDSCPEHTFLVKRCMGSSPLLRMSRCNHEVKRDLTEAFTPGVIFTHI